MKKMTRRTVNVSTAVAIGLAAVAVGRRAKQEKPITFQLPYQKVDAQKIAVKQTDLYTHDDDLGYC